MKTIKWVVAIACVVGTFVVASPAGATSIGSVSSLSYRISADAQAVSDAASDQDLDALASACSDMYDDTQMGMTFSRPRGIPKASWRHTMKAWDLMNQSADACMSGAENVDPVDLRRSVQLITRAGNELELATDLLPS